MQQLQEFDGKKFKSTTKEGLDIEGEDEKKKLEVLKAEFQPLKMSLEKVALPSGLLSWTFGVSSSVCA